ncbi:MAG: DUF1573 domain-containing protein [Desulfosarcina sp.]|nr:DUF1573 domain-containing protein [Desulfobacterales bacterium]
MIKKFSVCTILIFSILFIHSLSFGEETKESISPLAFFPEKNFTFDAIVEGKQIEHSFKLINKGTAPLFVQKVKAG